MRLFSRTLRFKLALLYLLLFGVIQGLLYVMLLIVREAEIRREFDAGLAERMHLIVDALDTAGSTRTLARSVQSLLNSAGFANYMVEIRNPDGFVLTRSPQLVDIIERLPSAAFRVGIGESLINTVSMEPQSPSIIPRQQHAVRVLSYKHPIDMELGYFVMVARDTSAIQDAVADLRRVFLITLPIGLVAFSVASWYAARRSLAPIGMIAREARKLSVSDLHHRLPDPGGSDELSEMIDVLNKMLDRLEQAFRAQERFIADVSHELQTPLTVLISEAQLLAQRERAVGEYVHFAASVQDELRRLTRIIRSLLMLARADSGEPLYGTEPVDLNDVALDTIERCQAEAFQRGIALMASLSMSGNDPHGPVSRGDADLLGTALANLVRNAVRFSPAGEKVDISVKEHGDQVIVSVRDRGPGIPQEHLDRIFDRFYQLPTPTGTTGTGLGLAIAKAIANMHGGFVQVRNHPEGGCEASLRLPRDTAE